MTANRLQQKFEDEIFMQLLTAQEVAHRLGYSPSWFYRNRKTLYRNGFPPPLPAMKRWDLEAISDWVRARSSNENTPQSSSASQQALNEL